VTVTTEFGYKAFVLLGTYPSQKDVSRQRLYNHPDLRYLGMTKDTVRRLIGAEVMRHEDLQKRVWAPTSDGACGLHSPLNQGSAVTVR
jgi:hypothetical protein